MCREETSGDGPPRLEEWLWESPPAKAKAKRVKPMARKPPASGAGAVKQEAVLEIPSEEAAVMDEVQRCSFRDFQAAII